LVELEDAVKNFGFCEKVRFNCLRLPVTQSQREQPGAAAKLVPGKKEGCKLHSIVLPFQS
jgi:hypothetical protein